MEYNYQLIDGEYHYQITDDGVVRRIGSYPDTTEDIEALLEVLAHDEEILKEREGQPI